MRPGIHLLLAVALGGGLALPAAGQTGRIAHFSHGGSVGSAMARMEIEKDNFGTPAQVIDSVVVVSDSIACFYVRVINSNNSRVMFYRNYRHTTNSLGKPQMLSRDEAYRRLRQEYPEAQLIGFDKQTKTVQPVPKKPASRTQTFQRRPFQYSHWRGLATVAALGAVGWLLGRKPKTV